MSDPFAGDDLIDIPAGAESHVTAEACPYCRQDSALDVTPFRWQSTRLLQWRCRRCQNTWIMTERRAHDR
jgi:hypothetical protein